MMSPGEITIDDADYDAPAPVSSSASTVDFATVRLAPRSPLPTSHEEKHAGQQTSGRPLASAIDASNSCRRFVSADTSFIPKRLIVDRSSLKTRYAVPRAGHVLAKTAVSRGAQPSFPPSLLN